MREGRERVRGKNNNEGKMRFKVKQLGLYLK